MSLGRTKMSEVMGWRPHRQDVIYYAPEQSGAFFCESGRGKEDQRVDGGPLHGWRPARSLLWGRSDAQGTPFHALSAKGDFPFLRYFHLKPE